MKTNFDRLYDELDERLLNLFKKFLEPYLEEITNSIIKHDINYKVKDNVLDDTLPSMKIDIESYVVLAHAAFEFYFEELAKTLVKLSIHHWETTKEINDTILLLVSYMLSSDINNTPDDEDENTQEAPSKLNLKISTKGDNTRTKDTIVSAEEHIQRLIKGVKPLKGKSLIGAETFFFTSITKNNGIGLKYLLKVLIPVGISVQSNIVNNLEDSLKNLKEYRGEAAHKNGIKKEINPLDIYKASHDIFVFCNEIRQRANSKTDKLNKKKDI